MYFVKLTSPLFSSSFKKLKKAREYTNYTRALTTWMIFKTMQSGKQRGQVQNFTVDYDIPLGPGISMLSLVLSHGFAKYHEILTKLAENTQIYHFGGFLGIWEVTT